MPQGEDEEETAICSLDIFNDQNHETDQSGYKIEISSNNTSWLQAKTTSDIQWKLFFLTFKLVNMLIKALSYLWTIQKYII